MFRKRILYTPGPPFEKQLAQHIFAENTTMAVTVGVLALQGGFLEHLTLLHKSARYLESSPTAGAKHAFDFIEVRNPEDLARCDGLIIPGGESTTIALIAAQSGLLEPLRNFVK